MDEVKIEIIAVCPICGNYNVVTATPDGYRAWKSGTAIQKALPSLSADEHEMLQTGICAACWKIYITPSLGEAW